MSNAASGPDPDANQGPPGTNFVQNSEVSLENDANQIGDFASANWPSDPADEATDIATSLYSMSFGVFGVNTNASTASIETGTVPAGDPTSFAAKTLSANGVTNTIARERANTYPMSRTLFNIYRTDTVRASTAGFLNWLCDSNSSIKKGTDHVDGGNFDTDLTNTINGTYGFSRVSDLTQEVATTTPADNVAGGGVDGTCDANLAIAPGGISAGSTTVTLSAAPPSVVAAGWAVQVAAGSNVSIPAGDTIQSISGTTVTLTAAPVTGTSGGPTPTTLYFPGQAPILQINTPGS